MKAYGLWDSHEGKARRAIVVLGQDGTVKYVLPHFNPGNVNAVVEAISRIDGSAGWVAITSATLACSARPNRSGRRRGKQGLMRRFVDQVRGEDHRMRTEQHAGDVQDHGVVRT